VNYQRNGPCHCLQLAADGTGPLHGLAHTATDFNWALFRHDELVLMSIQNSLHKIGHLEALKTETLFPLHWGLITSRISR
jgi:hypothetical protein